MGMAPLTSAPDRQQRGHCGLDPRRLEGIRAILARTEVDERADLFKRWSTRSGLPQSGRSRVLEYRMHTRPPGIMYEDAMMSDKERPSTCAASNP